VKHVALIGFMGAGKTTVGKILARNLGFGFVDTDALVERERGAIAAIFTAEGEEAFRRYECEAVAEALRNDAPRVIAVGGGAVTYPQTKELLASKSVRVFLDVPQSAILARVRRAPVRPLLGRRPSMQKISALYRERLPLYLESEVVVDCAQLTPAAVTLRIEELLRRAGALS
jgi:shikimate kinase